MINHLDRPTRKSGLLTAAAAPWTASAPAQGAVGVFADGGRAPRGDVVVRLSRSADGFPSDRAAACRAARRAVSDPSMTLVFYDVPEGPLAAVAFHDEDGDGRIRLDARGRPLDGVSATNEAGGSRPAFRRLALRVTAGTAALARLRRWYP